MAAEIEKMMYYGAAPWWVPEEAQGGTTVVDGMTAVKLDNPATAAIAIKAGGLDWEVNLAPILVADPACPGLGGVSIKNRRATVRSDRPLDKGVLGIVSHNYLPIQNREAFKFFDQIVGEGKAIYHTAGCLKEGVRIWLLAKLPETIEIVPGDAIEQFLLLTNAHDGTEAARIRFTPVRVVCQNTLNMALATQDTIEARVRHIGGLTWQFKNAAELLGITTKAFGDTALHYRAMAGKQMGVDGAAEYFRAVVPDNPLAVCHTRTENMRSVLNHLYENGRGNDMAQTRGTLWAAYNAVTEYIDHVRMGAATPQKRLYGTWFGTGADLRRDALKEADKLLVG